MAPKNVTMEEVGLGPWDKYGIMNVEQASHEIFDIAQRYSKKNREYYWEGINFKKNASKAVRLSCIVLIASGIVLPIIAAIFNNTSTKLLLTQVGVATLAIAGVLVVMDRVFGWSSGWLRYMITVTAMEDVTRKFTKDWEDYMIKKGCSLNDTDKELLFKKAEKFENTITKIKNGETAQWVSEFNSGLNLLNNLINLKKEDNNKIPNVDEFSNGIPVYTSHDTSESEEDQKPGSIEISLIHKDGPVPVKIGIDDEDEVTFKGTCWSKIKVSPGIHKVQVQTIDQGFAAVQKIVEVIPGNIEHIEVKIP